MTGFKKFINDRIPKTWDIGLRWCRSKTKWIDYVYDTHVRPISNDWRVKERNKRNFERVIEMTGGKNRFGDKTTFDLTINTHTLIIENKHEYDYWMSVIKWVRFFSKNLIYLNDAAECLYRKGMSIDEAAEDINTRFKLNDIKLSKFILKESRLWNSQSESTTILILSSHLSAGLK